MLLVSMRTPMLGQDNAPATAKPSSANSASSAEDQRSPASLAPKIFVKNILIDQRDLWTAPARFRVHDLNWLLPAVGLTAGMITADSELSGRINSTGTLSKQGGNISNAGLAAAVAGAGGLYFLGKLRQDDHQRESGLLAGEAALNAFLATEVFKVVTQRERPSEGTGQGRFWKGTAGNSSFPSNHAAITWSVATVIAHEYPSPFTKVLAYGLATGVSFARVEGKYHFPTDALIGSGLGYLIGTQVYARHHDPDLPGGAWGTFVRAPRNEIKNTDSMSSPYVPLDSWIYAAFDRLYALGAVPSAVWGIKPWTRMECARLLEELETQVDQSTDNEVARSYSALSHEFAPEMGNPGETYIALDSIYTRATGISGPPLTDSYHFGQTITDDYGRPYQRGFNSYTGFTSSASVGFLGFFVRGEFQHSPSAPGVSQAVVNAIQQSDQKPLVASAGPVNSVDRVNLLDAYVTLAFKGWQASFGKQSLWLGPTTDPFLFSNNAEPIYMFRMEQASPRKLPGFLQALGYYKIELFVGKLSGQHFVNNQLGSVVYSLGRSLQRQPMINGQKITFKPTPNFEFGVGRTGLWGGPNFPITLGTTRHSLFGTGNAAGLSDPGDRRSSFDFTYRIPGLRNWLTLYNDEMVEDEISPIGYFRRAAQNQGLYMPQVPGISKLDLRFEAGYTNLPGLNQPPGGGFFYWNTRYLDGYTNRGQIMGSTIGRQGLAFRAASTYWFAPDKTIQLGYNNVEVDRKFLQGGNLRGIHLRSEWNLSNKLSLSSFMQYEWWNFPLLTSGNKQTNFTASLQVTYWPHWKIGAGK
jgi:capsule assembly protein Wzi/PAP2 superfamily protein